MKASTLSLHDLTFLNVHIDVDMDFQASGSRFDFDGVQFRCDVRHGRNKNHELPLWWVGVDLAIVSSEEKRCPYSLDVKAAGLFTVDASIPKDKEEAFVYESGAAMVYGAIREMVASITGRSVHGVLTLPTASFFGTFAEREQDGGHERDEPEGPEDGTTDA